MDDLEWGIFEIRQTEKVFCTTNLERIVTVFGREAGAGELGDLKMATTWNLDALAPTNMTQSRSFATYVRLAERFLKGRNRRELTCLLWNSSSASNTPTLLVALSSAVETLTSACL